MPTTTTERTEAASPTTSPGAAFSTILSTGVGLAAATVEDWTDRLNAVATRDGSGAKRQAGARGVQAALQGKNPVWAAIKGAWAGGSTTVKAVIVSAVVALVLLLVLSPVLLLVVLLTGLIVAAVHKTRSAKKK